MTDDEREELVQRALVDPELRASMQDEARRNPRVRRELLRRGFDPDDLWRASLPDALDAVSRLGALVEVELSTRCRGERNRHRWASPARFPADTGVLVVLTCSRCGARSVVVDRTP